MVNHVYMKLVCFLHCLGFVVSAPWDATMLNSIKSNLKSAAQRSWEIGTEAQTLLELDYPSISVYGSTPFPPKTPPVVPSEVNDIAVQVMQRRPDGSDTLIPDGAVGDPASIGVAVLIANWTVGSNSQYNFAQAAAQQLHYLLSVAPKTDDGAISHRSEQVQLWSDFIYMAPPFIAYFGGATNNQTLLQIAYNQCRLYRNYLQSSGGLWRHMALGAADAGLWSTGNGWVAAGMARVLATILKSSSASQMHSQTNDLATWVLEIVNGSMPFLQSDTTLLPDYMGNTGSSFAECSGTALIASAVYRVALLGYNISYGIPFADSIYNAIGSRYVNSQGWMDPVVNPYDFGAQGSNSPEGQAFALLLYSARRDWLQAKHNGLNGNPHGSSCASFRLEYVTILAAVVARAVFYAIL